MTNGLICIGMLVIGLIINVIRGKTWSCLVRPLKGVALQILGALVGTCRIIAGVRALGLTNVAADFLSGSESSGSLFLL